MTGTPVLLVRHTEVARAWRGRCYGRSDVPLSRTGKAQVAGLAAYVAAQRPAWVVHSGLSRTRLLAEQVAALSRCPLLEMVAWQERDFGRWESQSWHAIYRATGSAMDGMISHPDDFRPGGGETTSELALRTVAAWESLPGNFGIVVTHGGPIAALLGHQQAMPVADWPNLVPVLGGIIRAER